MTNRREIYKPREGIAPQTPKLIQLQKARLRNLERCADRYQKVTGNPACERCPRLADCVKAWDILCGAGEGKAI